MKFALWLLTLFVIMTAITFGAIQIDLLLFPSIVEASKDWPWYYYVISKHAVAVVYAKSWFWLIYPWVIALVGTYLIMIRDGDQPYTPRPIP